MKILIVKVLYLNYDQIIISTLLFLFNIYDVKKYYYELEVKFRNNVINVKI